MMRYLDPTEIEWLGWLDFMLVILKGRTKFFIVYFEVYNLKCEEELQSSIILMKKCIS